MKLLRSVKTRIPADIRKSIRKKCAFLYPKIKKESWGLDHIHYDGRSIEIRGWAISPKRALHHYGFTVNGVEFDRINHAVAREDIEGMYWYLSPALRGGFCCGKEIKADRLFLNGFASFSFVDGQTGIPLRREHNYYCFDVAKDTAIPVPDENRRIRVQGNPSGELFRLEGFSTFRKLEMALKGIFGREFSDFPRILDWGCGCGRLSRYFRWVEGAGITGIDIDQDNIGWCQRHLKFGSFHSVSIHPPTPFSGKSFDLIIGISVFTHLGEKDQFEWLEELSRISSDRAVLLMTFHGDEAIRRSVLAPEFLLPLKAKGFLDMGPDPVFDGVTGHREYYRNTYHLSRYILKKWSPFFEIVEIIPGCIGNLQDLVVMRKK